jgi:hypothetical protein
MEQNPLRKETSSVECAVLEKYGTSQNSLPQKEIIINNQAARIASLEASLASKLQVEVCVTG